VIRLQKSKYFRAGTGACACPWSTVEIGGFPLLADAPHHATYVTTLA